MISKRQEERNEQCSICKENFRQGTDSLSIPTDLECDHKFHKNFSECPQSSGVTTTTAKQQQPPSDIAHLVNFIVRITEWRENL